MFNYITIFVVFGLLSMTTGKPLYPTAGSSQLDVRNNYNTGSGYSTAIGYASPLASRIVASTSPIAYSAPFARYSPSVIQAAPFAYGARFESPVLAAAGYASPYAAAQYASPYQQSITPFAPGFASPYPYSTAYGSPYSIATPGSTPILL